MLKFMLAIFAISAFKIVFECFKKRNDDFKWKYPHKVRNDFRAAPTIIENSVCFAALILFAVFSVKSFFDGHLVVCGFFVALGCVCAGILYDNNAILIYADRNTIHIRRHFLRCSFALSDFERSVYLAESRKYLLCFGGEIFPVPENYRGLSSLLRSLHALKTPFCTKNGAEFLKNYIKERTARPTFLICADFGREPRLTDSKFGGIPYWNPGMEYPVDNDGRKMQLLCQINFSEIKENDGLLPSEGILQFFMSIESEVFDREPPDDKQSNCRVVFHGNVDGRVREEDVLPLVPSGELDSAIVKKPCAVSFCRSVSYMSPSDFRFDDVVLAAAKTLTNDDESAEDARRHWNDFANPFAEEIVGGLFEPNCRLLGNPDFALYDARSSRPKGFVAYYDTTLLQMTFGCNGDESEIFRYKDGETLTFLMNSEALKRRDFSEIFCYIDFV